MSRNNADQREDYKLGGLSASYDIVLPLLVLRKAEKTKICLCKQHFTKGIREEESYKTLVNGVQAI